MMSNSCSLEFHWNWLILFSVHCLFDLITELYVLLLDPIYLIHFVMKIVVKLLALMTTIHLFYVIKDLLVVS
ncbi:unnamed protein product [Schistosoma mattheei]|uniref:Uncharacterized protein n=1 Tax=Schistosoma mattheei TaxID=31246 RepID=A0A183NIZ9_9TREM|nr:unnamed protein product [Schistosoma mattheei]